MGFAARAQAAASWRLRKLRTDVQFFPVRFEAWSGAARNAGRHRVISEAELGRTRKSDTIFVFGSGYSLNAIPADEWCRIARHDTMGFNWFVHQGFVRCDYHLVREIGPTDLDESVWRAYLVDYFDRLRTNPMFSDTILLVQRGFNATNGNRAIWLNLIPSGQRVFRWKSIPDIDAPITALSRGLAHGRGTLCECVNFAALMGWTRIVLTGVDLYDRRYFWLGHDEPRLEDPTIEVTHATALAGIVSTLADWSLQLRARGIQVFVHNPRSLLAQALPVWNPAQG